jgi:phosphomannomutase
MLPEIGEPRRIIGKIFRAYDVRGIYPSEISEELVKRIGHAYGKMAAEKNFKNVIVSHDVRIGSPQLALAIIAGITELGYTKVGFAGMLPIGTAAFYANKTGSELIYITASHLPSEWNGIKLVHPSGTGWVEDENFALRDIVLADLPEMSEQTGPKKVKVHEEDEYRTEEGYIRVKAEEPKTLAGISQTHAKERRHTVIDPEAAIANYNRHIITKIRPRKRLRVVIDCGNGATSVVAPKLFSLGGFEVKALWAQPDGRFPNRCSDPNEDGLGKLAEAVRHERASLGIAFDGDGDRMVILDENGKRLTPEQVAFVILAALLKNVKGGIVANVECSRLIDDVAQRFGSSVIRVPVGHNHISEAVETNKGAFALESSGHYCLPALVPFDDAEAISYYFACILSGSEKTLSSVISEITPYPLDRTNFVCEDERKFKVMEKIRQRLSRTYANMNTMDGVRIETPEGWVLVRASNTEPKIKLTVEANTAEHLERLKAEFTSILKKEMSEAYSPSILSKMLGFFSRSNKAK